MSVQLGIYNVGGSIPLIADVPFRELRWNHQLDRFGVAEMTLPCIDDILLNTHPFVHEVRITDDGELAFAGPIRYNPMPLQQTGDIQIVAYDVAYWLAVRFVNVGFDYTGTGTAVDQIVLDIASNALGPLDPNLLPFLNVQPCPTIHERKSVSIFDAAWKKHLETIVGKLMHMSVHGRAINFWCIDTCLSDLPDVSVDQFKAFPHLVRDGDTFTTEAAVYGDTTGPIIGTAGGPHPIWPVLVQRQFEDTSYLDVGSATAAAAAKITLRAGLGSAEDERFAATVDCDQPWPFTKLAPGMCTTIATPYGRLRLRISNVSGEVSGGKVTRKVEFRELQ